MGLLPLIGLLISCVFVLLKMAGVIDVQSSLDHRDNPRPRKRSRQSRSNSNSSRKRKTEPDRFITVRQDGREKRYRVSKNGEIFEEDD